MRTVLINVCQHTKFTDDTVSKGGAWKTPFAFADRVLNRRFIDNQWLAKEKLHILFEAIRY